MMVDEEERELDRFASEYKFHKAQERERIVTSCASFFPSFVRRMKAEDDEEIIDDPIFPGKLKSRFIRNTNATGVYEQDKSNCFAYAACSAYINTILRIYGSRAPPSFAECYRIADYNHGEAGSCVEALRLLEDHFHYGIRFDVTDSVTIRDIITLSVIVSFSTSRQGWKNIARGEFLKKPIGFQNGRHAALAEGYDFDKDCIICKNSWGDETARPRFNFSTNAPHDYKFIRVYFTIDSIRGKTTKVFNPNMKKFKGTLKGKQIDCAWMDEKTAVYCSDYVCEYHYDRDDNLKYLGYDVSQWIAINLNR